MMKPQIRHDPVLGHQLIACNGEIFASIGGRIFSAHVKLWRLSITWEARR